jgi:chromate transporter
VNDGEGALWIIAVNFALLSLIAVGGVNPILPELQRQAVDVYGWMSGARFTDLFAIAQAAPGPNLLVVTLIGWDVAGLPGALMATLAICAPSGVLAYFVSRLWDRFRLAPWRVAIQAGLIPVTIGLVAAGAYVIARTADTSAAAFLITISTAIALFYTRLHPLLFLAAGAAVGLAGLI